MPIWTELTAQEPTRREKQRCLLIKFRHRLGIHVLKAEQQPGASQERVARHAVVEDLLGLVLLTVAYLSVAVEAAKCRRSTISLAGNMVKLQGGDNIVATSRACRVRVAKQLPLSLVALRAASTLAMQFHC